MTVAADWLTRTQVRAAWCIAAFNAADLAVTKLAIDRGAHEGNPLAAWLIATWLIIPAKAAVCAVVLYSAGRVRNPSTAARMWFVAGLYGCVVLVNLLTLARYQFR